MHEPARGPGAIDERCLILIQDGGAPPLFCVHSGGGSIGAFRRTALLLGRDHAVYGLQAVGLFGDRPPLRTLEGMAAYYVRQVRLVQKTGPYLLCAWSIGGVIAFEMARQLRLQQQDVTRLVLIDPPLALFDARKSPTPDREWMQRARWIAYMAIVIGGAPDELQRDEHEFWRLGDEQKLAYIFGMAKGGPIFSANASLDSVRTLFTFFDALSEGVRRYRPRSVLPCPVTLFLLPGRDEAESMAGWPRFMLEHCETVSIEDIHLSVLRDPRYELIAPELQRCLARAMSGQKPEGAPLGVSPPAP